MPDLVRPLVQPRRLLVYFTYFCQQSTVAVLHLRVFRPQQRQIGEKFSVTLIGAVDIENSMRRR